MFFAFRRETLLTAMERDGIARWQQGLDAIGAVHARQLLSLGVCAQYVAV